MKRFQAVTYSAFNRAVTDIQKEFYKLGIWHEQSKLLETEVFLCQIPQLTLIKAFGYHLDNVGRKNSISERIATILGYEPGHIYIPAISSNTVIARKWSLREVIRHEYAHSVAFRYPKLVKTKEFIRVFGWSYDGIKKVEMPDDAYVSEYAKEIPAEDFAKTWSTYLTRKYKPENKRINVKLKMKFEFVAQLLGKLVLI